MIVSSSADFGVLRLNMFPCSLIVLLVTICTHHALGIPSHRYNSGVDAQPYQQYQTQHIAFPRPDTSRAYEITNHVNQLHSHLNGKDSGYIQSSYSGTAASDQPIQGYLYYYNPVPHYSGNSKKSSKSKYSFSPNLFTGFFMGPLVLLMGLSFLLPFGSLARDSGRSFGVEDHSSILQNTKEILLKLDQTYNAAVGSELCLKRIVCELGARNQNLENGYKNVITRLMTDLTPENYKQFTEDFTAGLLRGKCEKFKCVTNLSKLFSTLNNIIL